MTARRRQKIRKVQPRTQLRLLNVLLLLGLALSLLLYGRQGLLDTLSLRDYVAPSTVATIASRDTMTPKARQIFYVNRPEIADKASFPRHCPSNNEQTVVLGCYHGIQGGIYVLAVRDSRLSGIEEVTAAHEMLHAAYDRLSGHQKQQVDAQLTQYFEHGLQDARIKAQIESYKQTEPGQMVNEMHSILGTEVPNLPAGLESYYKRYFTNRSAVTGFYAQYEAAFTGRQAAVKADDAKLAALKTQIESAKAALQVQVASLRSQQAQLDRLRASGDPATYNAQVPAYNEQVDSYKAAVAAAQGLVDSYNDLVNQRNALALESQQLMSEITSTVSPAKQ